MTQEHRAEHWPLTCPDRYGNERTIGVVAACACGVLVGSTPGAYALKVYAEHRARQEAPEA